MPYRSLSLKEEEVFEVFVRAVFYVGKGSRGRPYHHLYEAILAQGEDKQPSEKVVEGGSCGLYGIKSLRSYSHLVQNENLNLK